MDAIGERIAALNERVRNLQADGLYFMQIPSSALDGPWVTVDDRRMLMLASYSYLGLLGHPDIARAAHAALDRFGAGTHGVRLLAGTLTLHRELEETIARFKRAEDAVAYSSGYVTNLSVISTLVGRGDAVISDKLNHASILDGCLLSRANLIRFRHNDMADLERALIRAGSAAKLVIVDAVFSMDGDVINLPEVNRLCKYYRAWLMVDEAHSLGVLGRTGHGIEEHFDLPPDAIDIKMGTLSKTIPSVGGYIAGNRDLITYLKHVSRAYIFSAALPPASAAAAKAAFEVIEREPWRVEKLRQVSGLFLSGLRALGFDTLRSETAIVPVITGDDDRAFQMTRACHRQDVFALPVVSPGVPVGLARLRATVTAAHDPQHVERALEVFAKAGREVGVI
ncbi:MAG TPA: pyridoxal phosphate-dependent aminotransferase family protein [Anaerolineae bacterium]|nr:pyridoxal phosphate-dependent aminotransferase family protein [Anaerolineae bacterium]